MKRAHRSRAALAPLLIAVLLAALAMGFGAAQARASDGGMSGMSGMSEEEMQSMPGMSGMSADEMQNMTTPTPAPSETAMSGSMSGGSVQTGDLGPAMDPHMDMGGGSVNWFVIGGFVALVVGSTLGAVATKRHLARRMAAGELAGAGALDV